MKPGSSPYHPSEDHGPKEAGNWASQAIRMLELALETTQYSNYDGARWIPIGETTKHPANQLSHVIKYLGEGERALINVFGYPNHDQAQKIHKRLPNDELEKLMAHNRVYNLRQRNANCTVLSDHWVSDNIQHLKPEHRAKAMADFTESKAGKKQEKAEKALKEIDKKLQNKAHQAANDDKAHNTHMIAIALRNEWLNIYDPNWGEYHVKRGHYIEFLDHQMTHILDFGFNGLYSRAVIIFREN